MNSFNKIEIIIFFSVIFFFIFPQKINAQVLINEFSPKNPEWVEIINKNSTEINLSGYYFDDDADFNSDSGNSGRILLQGLLSSNTLCYLDINSYLNDSGDIPTLFAPNGDISDTYTYASSSANLSYSRVPDGGDWQVGTVFSKTQNSCSSLPTPTPSPTPSPTTTPTQTATATSTPTVSPTVKPTPTKSATPKSSPSPSTTDEPMNLISDIKINEETPLGMVAGASVEKKFPTIALIFIIFGIAFLGYGGFLLYNTKHDLQDKSNQIN